MTFTEWMDSVRPVLGAPLWLIQLFFTVLLTAAVSHGLGRLLRRLQGRLQHNGLDWDDALLEGLRPPVRLLVWLLGLTAALELVDSDIRNWEENLEQMRRVGVVGVVAWFTFRFAGEYQTRCIARLQQEPGHDPTAILAVGRLVRASIVITAALVVLETLGFSISGVLAFGGIGGVAVGFAAKDMLANFFGGLMIFLDRPFTVGDWIKSPDRSIEGTVEQIGWRITVVRSFEKEPVYIPNSTFSSIAVVTPSRMSHRRLREILGIRYSDMSRVPALVERIRAHLSASQELDQDQGIMVCADGFGESAVNVLIQAYSVHTAWVPFMQMRHQLLLDIAAMVQEAGADFAFPTRTIMVEQSDEDSNDRDSTPLPGQNGRMRRDSMQ